MRASAMVGASAKLSRGGMCGPRRKTAGLVGRVSRACEGVSASHDHHRFCRIGRETRQPRRHVSRSEFFATRQRSCPVCTT